MKTLMTKKILISEITMNQVTDEFFKTVSKRSPVEFSADLFRISSHVK